MQAEIKQYNTLDEVYQGELGEIFNFIIEMEIGPIGDDKSDLFSVEICSPLWIVHNTQPGSILMRKGLIITENSDEDVIIAYLSKRISAFQTNTWDDLSKILSYLFNWEYDNYRE